ncbi:hypothetical protein AVEN_205341-1 [Araneus ventricosus]|uniref:Uncharacterized protein n=1 Tax=Araneus ventricosus TaxID=182803 RepID=A0A4Y2LNY5_ARAVE|nr:hypothetical protein AVEN_205341-1 [Araneus ventricosus]
MINKPRATADEGNQPQGSNSVQARWLSSSVQPQSHLEDDPPINAQHLLDEAADRFKIMKFVAPELRLIFHVCINRVPAERLKRVSPAQPSHVSSDHSSKWQGPPRKSLL